MLSAAHRMRRSADFARAVRHGVRSGRPSVVVHLGTRTDPGQPSPVVGFVVSKAVGNAVTRNVVKRRLREVVRPHVDELPPSAALVVRALPAAAERTFDDLRADVLSAVGTVTRRAAAQAGAAGSAAGEPNRSPGGSR